MPNQEKDDKASSGPSSSSKSSGGYSGNGGMDSPSERGGRGTTGSPSDTKSTGSGSSTKSSGGNSGSSASSAGKSSSSGGGTGRPSGYSSGSGNSGSSDRPYSSKGGQDSPSEGIGRAQPSSQPSKTSISKGFASAYQDMAKSALGAGVTSIGGGLMPSQPSASSMGGFRQAEIQSMNNLYGYEKEAVRVVDAGPGWTQVQLRDGTVETRRGDRASRNNNPGNIEYGRFTKKVGAVGTDGRFAVFPDRETGLKAIGSLLDGPSYRDLSIGQAITRYAPPFENNTTRYANTVASRAGVDTSTRLADLSPEQKSSLVEAMMSVEGNTGYKTTTNVVGQGYGTPPSGSVIKGDRQFASTPATGPTPAGRPEEVRVATQNGGYIDPMVVKVDPPAQATPEPRVAQVDRFKEKYLGTPATGPTPAARPEVAEAPKELTTGQKIAAGAIDIGAGFIPVVGTGLGIVNAGLQLTGNQTIGQRLVAGLGEGTGEPPPPSQGSDRDYPVATMETPPVEVAAAAPAPIIPPVQRFVSTYLRPTPRDKWSRA